MPKIDPIQRPREDQRTLRDHAEAESGDPECQPISVLISDAHPLLAGTLENLLSSQSGIEIVSHSSSLDDVAHLLAESARQIDVVILHVVQVNDAVEKTIHGIAGGDAADSKPYVLVVSGSESDDEVLACVRSGARGYVSITAGFPVLLLAVHLIAQGGAGFSASAATRLSTLTWKDSAAPNRGTLAELTKREREVLELLAQGYNNRRIARELFLSERTVRNHLTRVFLKLGVRDRLHAAIVARNSLPAPA